jgi:hypothetical protein
VRPRPDRRRQEGLEDIRAGAAGGEESSISTIPWGRKLAIANVKDLPPGCRDARKGARPSAFARQGERNLESLGFRARETLPRSRPARQERRVIEEPAAPPIARHVRARGFAGLTATLQREVIPRGVLANADRTATAAGRRREQITETSRVARENQRESDNIRVIAERPSRFRKRRRECCARGELVEDSQALVRRTGEFWLSARERSRDHRRCRQLSDQILLFWPSRSLRRRLCGARPEGPQPGIQGRGGSRAGGRKGLGQGDLRAPSLPRSALVALRDDEASRGLWTAALHRAAGKTPRRATCSRVARPDPPLAFPAGGGPAGWPTAGPR